MRKFATALLVLAALTLAAPVVAAEGGAKAPDFTLRNIDNQEVKLSSLAGKVVLINFWATWCAPCQVEMPFIQTLYTKYKDQGFVVLAVSADDARSASKVKPLVKSKGWTFQVLLDPSSAVVALYNPQKTLPYSELVNHEGVSVWKHQGYNAGDEKELEVKVAEAIAAKAAAGK